MAKTQTPRQRLDALLERFSEEIRQAFLASIQEIRDTARIAAIADALQKGDVERALQLVELDPAAFRGLQRAIRTAFEETGVVVARDIPTLRDAQGIPILFRFDPGFPSAARWVENRGVELVTAILDDQKLALRKALSDGLEAGRAARTVALDVVGRLNRATGQREGGIVGLTSGQYQAVAGARDQLASSDPAALRAYLARQARDQRFDKAVIKAISDKAPIEAEVVERAVTQYENRLLALRGETIGRTEATQATGAAQREAFAQVIAKAGIDASTVTKVWRCTRDERTRDAHRAMDGQVVGFTQPFKSPDGALLMFPGDTSLGAPAKDVIGCRCVVVNRLAGRQKAAA
ncbi:phage Mu protein F like protein [Mesorhizobium loti]|uniref:Phage Mu protein F like protein n=1 Tax=Rhizobium loti TaxID=381 RepID=A0A8E3B2D4_RHILI|nr:phage minor head protein [Mesorhizobium loti]PWJ88360.1 phage Mu protein F like protein [Mesorhizobium loti]